MKDLLPSSDVTILVLDDDRVQLGVMRAMLASLNPGNTTLTDDPDAAWRCIDDTAVDLVFLDLNMPRVSGLEFMKGLGQRRFRGALVLMSGYDQRILESSKDLACSYDLRVLGVLRKPLQHTDIKNLLDTAANAVATMPHSVNHGGPALTTEDLARELAGETDCLQLALQAKYAMHNDSITGYEVLSRWQRGDESLPPSMFIPMAHESGQIHELSFLIFRKALQAQKRLQLEGFDLDLAINFSVQTLTKPDMVERLVTLAMDQDIDLTRLTFEITEDQIYGSIQDYLDKLMYLIFRGIKLSIDDFGTGQSSLSKLKAIPFAELKVDRSFVHGVAADLRSAAVLESSVQLAKQLGMRVVAEGGETRDDWLFAKRAGCDLFQGYYKAKPACLEQFIQLLQREERCMTKTLAQNLSIA